MFAKFLDAITAPAQQVVQATGKQIEREFQREASRAVQRAADRAAAEASQRIVGLFSAIAPTSPAPAAGSSGGPLRSGGLFAPPDDTSTV